jgi:hypothetical protein
MVSLTEEMRHALAEHPGQPVYVEDADTRQQYVLLRADLYQQIQPLIEAGELTDEEMLAAAAVANQGPEGWDAPGMDDYDGPGYDAPGEER